MREKLFMVLAIGGLATAASVADAALGKPSDGRVSFEALGPAGMRIEGTTSDISVVEDSEQIVLSVPLAHLKTGIEMRDRHMKEKYLDVAQYPEAKLKVHRSEIKLPSAGQKLSSDVPGTLELHGQSKAVTVHYELRGEPSVVIVDGKLHVNMKDVGIEVPNYLGVTVKPDVDINAHFRIASGS
jgi:polyisoprenoid-binding protein YceI